MLIWWEEFKFCQADTLVCLGGQIVQLHVLRGRLVQGLWDNNVGISNVIYCYIGIVWEELIWHKL